MKNISADFIYNKGSQRLYIESTFVLSTQERQKKEKSSLRKKMTFSRILLWQKITYIELG